MSSKETLASALTGDSLIGENLLDMANKKRAIIYFLDDSMIALSQRSVSYLNTIEGMQDTITRTRIISVNTGRGHWMLMASIAPETPRRKDWRVDESFYEAFFLEFLSRLSFQTDKPKFLIVGSAPRYRLSGKRYLLGSANSRFEIFISSGQSSQRIFL